MNGIEISRAFYEEYGKPMLEARFSDILPLLAVGFVGSGSEHYGFDDAISRDHDYEPGFCIFLPGEEIIDRRTAFLLERAYAKLPKEYAGIRRLQVAPVGGSRNGVFRTSEYYRKVIGSENGRLTLKEWLTLPEYALAEAVNGEVFSDPYGEFTAIRNRLIRMPEDIRRKRLAGSLLLMAQSGQYNFTRCLNHGEPEAAQLACNEYVRASMSAAFLLRARYMPFYKWSFRALRQLDDTELLADRLAFLLFGDNREPEIARQKSDAIEEIAALTVLRLQDCGLTSVSGPELEPHAYSVNDGITDSDVRTLHILAAVDR